MLRFIKALGTFASILLDDTTKALEEGDVPIVIIRLMIAFLALLVFIGSIMFIIFLSYKYL